MMPHLSQALCQQLYDHAGTSGQPAKKVKEETKAKVEEEPLRE